MQRILSGPLRLLAALLIGGLPIYACSVALSSCASPSNRRRADAGDLEKVQKADRAALEPYTPQRDVLTAIELIELADCRSLPCVQLFMKARDRDFVHASKGEFAALHRSAVADTEGKELVMPLSTFYVATEPQASWRAAHTVHQQVQANQLAAEFDSLQFTLFDSAYYLGLPDIQKHYTSPLFPDKHLYITATYQPWYRKGLYENKITWPCYIFEVYDRQLYIGIEQH
ncbi:hypothetical protein LL912_18730 [Niabella sp. CC-SYL272]|uniref:hypothetical protein n=1 Tax=Niabella agricola TaxID=2891571 RepID=UPI001F157A8A|nr:hypothetical protein [Niabella agricola]MCF3110827.1 hypothetical protein [Niabella agricola]